MKLFHQITLIKPISLGILFLTSAFIYSCEEDPFYFTYDYSDAPNLADVSKAIETIESEDGLIVYIMSEGSGTQEVTIRDNIFLFYTTFRGGTSRDNIVDSSYLNGSLASTQFAELGTYERTRGAGFVRGILGMKEGEHRVIMAPDSLNAYGEIVYWDVTLDYIAY
ncbi:MAG: hypothetical protein EBR32_06120 [Bacteroidetes bacterium]|nr:hypothetical protein [Bacteroidota bacterium]